MSLGGRREIKKGSKSSLVGEQNRDKVTQNLKGYATSPTRREKEGKGLTFS